jgi:ribosomal protein L30/L7E
MIAIIRITGQCKNKQTTDETLKRLKLGKKYTTCLIDPNDSVRMGMVESVRDSVVYGEISKELESELIEKRGKENKSVFFLHPPRGGFKKSTKLRYPKGILGHNPNIDKLIERML